jgi:hypothetical protein
MNMTRIAALLVLSMLSACNADGSVNWNAIGAGVLGVGLVAAGAAEAYSASRPVYYYPPPNVVIVCPYWGC